MYIILYNHLYSLKSGGLVRKMGILLISMDLTLKLSRFELFLFGDLQCPLLARALKLCRSGPCKLIRFSRDSEGSKPWKAPPKRGLDSHFGVRSWRPFGTIHRGDAGFGRAE